MDSLAKKEQKKYTALWNSSPEYRKLSPADYLTPLFLHLFHKQLRKNQSIIDFGCGAGRSAPPLLDAGLRVHLLDLCDNCLDPSIFLQTVGPTPSIHFTQACLWDLPPALPPSDWMICFDVLEHLPPSKIPSALSNIASRLHKGGLLSISLREDHFLDKPLTVRNALWWHETISRSFSISQELYTDAQCLVWAIKPR